MELGRRIYAYRTKRNMSQGDLAEALEVSRQSVSKWENGNATPDLDKLVKMAKLFGVTLDELVGNGQEGAASAPQIIVQAREPLSPKKVTGIVLLCFGLAMFLLMFWSSNSTALTTCLIYAAPLLLCGILCLKTTKNTLLSCILMLYFWLWLPMGIFAPNYIRGDYAKALQSLHMLWGGGLIFWGWKLRKRGVFCAEQRNAIVCFGTLAASILLSYLFMRFPGLLPTLGLLVS